MFIRADQAVGMAHQEQTPYERTVVHINQIGSGVKQISLTYESDWFIGFNMSENTRKQFEEWVSKYKPGLDVGRVRESAYWDEWTELAWQAWCEALKQPCITRVSTEHGGKAFSVYLRDHQRISVGRTIQTKGQAWLEIQKEAQVVPA